MKRKWHEGIFIGIKDESEVAVVGTPHGIVFAMSIRRVAKEDSGDALQQYSRPHGTCSLESQERS